MGSMNPSMIPEEHGNSLLFPGWDRRWGLTLVCLRIRRGSEKKFLCFCASENYVCRLTPERVSSDVDGHSSVAAEQWSSGGLEEWRSGGVEG